MQRSTWLRHTALAAVLALAVTACGGDDPAEEATTPDATSTDTAAETETEAEPTATGTATEAAPVEITGRGDGTLTIGRVLPETGFLDYLGAPMIAGVQLAIDDINAAGGVLGQEVTLIEEDSGTDPTVAVPNTNSALAEGADVIVGAAASGVTQQILDTLNQNTVYQCSPSATSPSFVEQENASHFFRTVPPDNAVGPVIAEEIVADGNGGNVVIAARSDDYGVGLAEVVAEELTNLGATVANNGEPITYTDEEQTFDTQAQQIVDAQPTAVLFISFKEAGTLINRVLELGGGSITPEIFYGADGIFSSQLPNLVNPDEPGIIDGMKVIGASGSTEFNERLAEQGVNDFIYGGQAYDCTMLLALWAAASGTDDTTQWDPQVLLDLTSGGTECSGFEECAGLIEAGEDVDYQGASGPVTLEGATNLGNPVVSTYSIAQFVDGGTLESVDSQEVELASDETA